MDNALEEMGGIEYPNGCVNVPLRESDGLINWEYVCDGGYRLEHYILSFIDRVKTFTGINRKIGHMVMPGTPLTTSQVVEPQRLTNVKVADAAYDYIWLAYELFNFVSLQRTFIDGLLDDDPTS